MFQMCLLQEKSKYRSIAHARQETADDEEKGSGGATEEEGLYTTIPYWSHLIRDGRRRIV